MSTEKNKHPNHNFLIPWDHVGEPPANQKADDFIKRNEGNIAYIETAAVSMYGTNWYCVSVWLIEKEKDSQWAVFFYFSRPVASPTVPPCHLQIVLCTSTAFEKSPSFQSSRTST